MEVTQEDAETYANISQNINNYFFKNPNKKFVILGGDALYMTFTNHAQNITPLYANYSGYTSGVYPYEQQLNEYIKKKKPLILITDYNTQIPKGYHTIKTWKKRRLIFIAP